MVAMWVETVAVGKCVVADRVIVTFARRGERTSKTLATAESSDSRRRHRIESAGSAEIASHEDH
jgi:hypothetical protein